MLARKYVQEYGFMGSNEHDFVPLNERGFVRPNDHDLAPVSERSSLRLNEHDFARLVERGFSRSDEPEPSSPASPVSPASPPPAINEAPNQAPTLALGSLASVGLGTRADDQASLTAFESLMGTAAPGILGFADDSTPQNSLARVQADAPEFAAMERPVNWAIPLAWESVSMADVAAGKHDATFTAIAETIVEHQTQDINPLLYVRLGWEANNEYPWKISSGPDNEFDQKLAADYVDAFQHVATLFRSVDDRFRIEWNQNYSKADANGVFYDLNEIYPGDEYVDVVGVDAYNVNRFSGQDDPVTAWEYKADAPFGLNWFSSFAAAHGKPLAMTEWGIDSDNFGHYVDELQEFVRTNNVIYTNYWNADARTNGNDTLTDGSKPATAAAIADAFGPEGNSALIPGKQSGLIVEAGTDAEGAALAGTASARIWAVASDPDAGDRVTFDTTGWKPIDATHFQKNGVYGSAVLDTGTGIMTYTLDNSRERTNALADEDQVTDDFSIAVRDTAGATAVQTAQFAIEGANDAMYSGGAGNDVFDFHNAADQVVELAGDGTDTVRTGFTHVLDANVERLELLHAGDAWGTGNELNNTLVGNAGDNVLRGSDGADVLRGAAGNDTLDGGTGADVMHGGRGDDVFLFDEGDQIVELAGRGVDTVKTGFTHTLQANVENLELLHAGDASGTGNSLGNVITGNAGNNLLEGFAGNDEVKGGSGADKLSGGIGNDVLSGGAGADTFVFDVAAGATNADVITDFDPTLDGFELSHDVFTDSPVGELAASAFVTGQTAASADDRVIYDDMTGALFYDSDGTGGAGQFQFASLTPHLAAPSDDFFIV